jgi:single-strand DNA-binding protein
MASLNQCQFIGNVGRTPEVRYSPSGDAICNFSVAINENWKDKSTGERRESTEWVRVVAYRRLGEICGEYLKSGAPVWIQGKLKTRKWQDKETGADRYSTDIVADQMQMLGSKDDGQEPARHHEDRKRPGPPMKNDYVHEPQSAHEPTLDDGDSIPF